MVRTSVVAMFVCLGWRNVWPFVSDNELLLLLPDLVPGALRSFCIGNQAARTACRAVLLWIQGILKDALHCLGRLIERKEPGREATDDVVS